jgi:hypothetical protein
MDWFHVAQDADIWIAVVYMVMNIVFVFLLPLAHRPIPFHGLPLRGCAITLRHIELGRTSLDWWLARHRDLYLTTHHPQDTSILANAGIRTHNSRIRAYPDPRFRPHSNFVFLCWWPADGLLAPRTVCGPYCLFKWTKTGIAVTCVTPVGVRFQLGRKLRIFDLQRFSSSFSYNSFHTALK